MATALISVFAVGSLALWLVNDSFPPIAQTGMQIGMICLWFVGAAVLTWAKKNDDDDDTDSYFPKKRYLLIALVPWIACGVVAANAMLDPSTASAHAMSVVTRTTGRNGSSVRASSGNTMQTIPINKGCYNRLIPGGEITVIEKQGALRIRWITGIAECVR